MQVEFYRHSINQEDTECLVKTLNSIFLSMGPETRKFEDAFATYLGSKYCLGMSSWTTGAFLTLKAWGIGEGDEVIVPPMTFIATANVALHCGAKPVFVDVEGDTGLIDVGKIEEAITPRTKVIIPIHLYGQMADMKVIRNIADKYDLRVLEDAAHCIEGMRDSIRPGQLGDAAVFSFYATKNITSGEGGAVVTNNSNLAEKLMLLRNHGMNKSAAVRYLGKYNHWDMELLGYKANMFDIQAILLLNQLKRIEEMWRKREMMGKMYEDAFAGVLDYPKVLKNTKHARHLFTIWVNSERRDDIISSLEDKKIGVAVNYRAIHLLKYYREKLGYKKGDFPIAEKIGEKTISLPLYPKLTIQEIEYVVELVKNSVVREK